MRKTRQSKNEERRARRTEALNSIQATAPDGQVAVYYYREIVTVPVRQPGERIRPGTGGLTDNQIRYANSHYRDVVAKFDREKEARLKEQMRRNPEF